MIDWGKAIEHALLVQKAYDILPGNLADQAGKKLDVGEGYTVVASIYANDLATDFDPARGSDTVSIGLICQADGTGEVVVALRGTEGILEWVHDAEFGWVPCPILPGSGFTEDGFTAMYRSFRVGGAPGPGVVAALATLPFDPKPTRLTICGHSLGGALATLLALDAAAHARFADLRLYTYASPRVGAPNFVSTFDQLVPNSIRIANRMDLVPKLPLPPFYAHVEAVTELNPVQFVPPRFLVRPELACEHALTTYLHLMSLQAGGTPLPLDAACAP